MMDRVVSLHERTAHDLHRRERGRLDARLKVEQKIARIKAYNPGTALDELEAVEKRIRAKDKEGPVPFKHMTRRKITRWE